MFLCWYYPIGYRQNAEPTNTEAERGALMFLFMFVYLVFSSTFAISKYFPEFRTIVERFSAAAPRQIAEGQSTTFWITAKSLV